MRILVFSDSHGDSESMEKVIKRFYPDAVIYLGDGIDDFFILEKEFPHAKFYNVAGNIDDKGDVARLERFEDVAIYMSHLESFAKIKADREHVFEAMKLNAKIILYGHTHVPELFVYRGITFMNPGTISKTFGLRTFGMIDLIDDDYLCEIMFADTLALNWIIFFKKY